MRRAKWWLPIAAVLLLAGAAWLAATDNPRVWPARNTLQYRALRWWWDRTGEPQRGAPGTLSGTVAGWNGQPVAGARVLVSRWDGTTYTATTGADGRYLITGLPEGTYVPVAGAHGFASVTLRHGRLPWSRVLIRAGETVIADAVLPPDDVAGHALLPAAARATDVSDATTLYCTTPLASEAVRHVLTFDHGRGRRHRAWLYVPVPTAPVDGWPLLLTVYPGPADAWECVSIPLAAAGYAVLAVGPPYSFALERDVDDLARLVAYVRDGQMARLAVDGRRIGLLAGSYSSLHAQRLLQRDITGSRSVQAALFLGGVADLFDMRRRLEEGTFIPPFGLDQGLIALGLPDRVPLRYWRYSSIYHVRRDLPPTALIHSRTDEVVPFQQSEQLARALAQAGAPYELHVLDGASHYLLSETGEALMIYDLTLHFLEQHLRSAQPSR